MILTPGEIGGSFIVEIEPRGDDRGFFARTWCEEEFAAVGVHVRCAQTNVSYNRRRGTIRGLHWQAEPYGETKLVRCTVGSVFDVMVDVRPDSPTYLRWQGVILTAERHNLVFVPDGCAHGYQALEDGAEITYQVSHAYVPGSERGIRWDDPTIGIAWPVGKVIVSDKDRSWPDLVPVVAGGSASAGSLGGGG